MRRTDHLPLRPYDVDAPQKFQAAKDSLRQLLPFPIELHHVGSSSVPGLGGKRVIDVLVLCPKERMQEVVRHLEAAGYPFNPEQGFGAFKDKFFVSGWHPYMNGAFHVHYHITWSGSEEHRSKLLFRDYLEQHPDVAEEYFRLKKEGHDKTRFVTDILQKAAREAARTRRGGAEGNRAEPVPEPGCREAAREGRPKRSG